MKYYDKIENINIKNAFVVNIDSTINSKQDLLKNLSNSLNFPDYFGINWDALYDCLRDFSWIKEHTIKIIHLDLPNLSKDELEIYIATLYDSVTEWKNGTEHILEVYFQIEYKDSIEAIIKHSKQEGLILY
jgi:RNAse (barnase) inhibitor barstar